MAATHRILHSRDIGFERARRTATRRRRRQTAVGTLALLVLGAATAATGYLAWTEYHRALEPDSVTDVDRRSTSRLIDDLENDPRWNGPGVPGLGMGAETP